MRHIGPSRSVPGLYWYDASETDNLWQTTNRLKGMVKAVHTQGFAPPIFDTALLKNIGQTAEWTFEDRIGMICRVLRVSKQVSQVTVWS